MAFIYSLLRINLKNSSFDLGLAHCTDLLLPVLESCPPAKGETRARGGAALPAGADVGPAPPGAPWGPSDSGGPPCTSGTGCAPLLLRWAHEGKGGVGECI